MSSQARPRFLILETSGRVGQVALAEGEGLRAVQRLDEGRRHARDLAPAVVALLKELGWKPRDIHAVLVSRGPGSYTGLRVGVMSAKAFAYATGGILLAIDTFAAVAAQAPAEILSLDVLADAQQEKVYVQRYARSQAGADVQAVSPLRIQPFAEWLAQRTQGTWATGPGLRVHGRRLPADAQVLDAELWDPQPASLLRLGRTRYATGERDDVWTLEPLYLRASSAEEKWAARDPPRSKPERPAGTG